MRRPGVICREGHLNWDWKNLGSHFDLASRAEESSFCNLGLTAISPHEDWANSSEYVVRESDAGFLSSLDRSLGRNKLPERVNGKKNPVIMT